MIKEVERIYRGIDLEPKKPEKPEKTPKLNEKKHYHFVGIGGAGMFALAKLLKSTCFFIKKRYNYLI